ncbi:glycosyltransferase family 4 protein [Candidatus Uabimicrobium amorphum]|uniref:Glycosyl transferase n=1 Tax=Uabimicrobium amorphum TaxID=2596890 RepID=A0A5S9IH34_UABAM|nr:glycosyltransferase family 1 protein [Candidatus Uabimicrobium amorphum]BBM81689.1 glycosyl transferase [Candidatus Uabimicrobium amorphum]
MIIAFDGSNIRAGGGVTHLTELLNHCTPEKYNIEKVVVWAPSATLQLIEDKKWLHKISHPWLDKSLPSILAWRWFYLAKHLRNCDLLVSVSGNYTGNFRPYISYCRNMLVFEKTEQQRYSLLSLTRWRFKMLNFVQRRSFKNADLVIFLCEYARHKVLESTTLRNSKIIPHGVSLSFRTEHRQEEKEINSYSQNERYKFLYVSIVNFYKHQWNVVKAFDKLIKLGYPLELHLVGGAYPQALQKLNESLQTIQPNDQYVHYHGKVGYKEIHRFYSMADAFIFASTCENMPNIVLEAMANRLPIVSSHYPPIKELLQDGGLYFNPLEEEDIVQKVKDFICNRDLRTTLAQKAWQRSQDYSWQRCAQETFMAASTMITSDTR